MARNPKISLNERLFLVVDSAKLPQHVAALGTFTIPDSATGGWVAELAARFRASRTFATPFNYRLTNPVLRRIAPSWRVLPDDQIDLNHHFRYHLLQEPGGERELGALVSQLHAERLDWSRPLWEFHLIDGLADGRFAVYFKVHHALMDGVGGIQRYTRMVTRDPADHTLRPLWTIGPAPKAVATQGRDAASAWRTLHGLRAARKDMKRNADGPVGSAAAAPYAAPRTVLNGRLGRERRVATQTFPIERIKATAKGAGVTVNDVFVTIVAGGIRRYLQKIGETTDRPLTAGTPVNLRTPGDEETGNAFSLVVVKIFSDVADPIERVKAVAASSRIAKGDIRSRPRAVASNYAALIGGAFVINQLTGLAGRRLPPFNLNLSCVPGPSQSLFLARSRLEGLYPIGVLYHGTTMMAASFTISGSFGIGFLGCPDTVPHLQKIAVYTGEALDELDAALGIGVADPAGRT